MSSTGKPLPKFDHFEAITAQEFAKRPPPTWDVAGLIPSRSITVLFGKSQSRKSFLAIALAERVASGQPFMGREVRQGRVLYVALEDSFDLQSRFKVGSGDAELEADRILVSESGVTLPRSRSAFEDMRKFLRSMVIEGRPITTVIFDTYAYMNDGDENEATDATETLRYLRQLVVEFDLTVVLIHHPGNENENRPRGSTALFSGVACVLQVRDEGKDRSSITVRKNKGARIGEKFIARFVVVQLDDGSTTLRLSDDVAAAPFEESDLQQTGDPRHDLYIEVLRAAGPKGLAHGDWATAMQKAHRVSLNTFNKLLRTLKNDARVRRNGKIYTAVPVPD